jgi:hypothetical protein
LFLLTLIVALFFTLPSILEGMSVTVDAAEALTAQTHQLRQAEPFALLLTLLSAVTFISWRYPRRDYASPRRMGRRI